MMPGKDAVVVLHLLYSRIIIRRDYEVKAILEILLNNLDLRGLAIKNQVENVSAALFRMQAYPVSCPYLSYPQ